MKRDYFISVAMATYNGEKYIKDQLDSILKQLSMDDEIIVSDDGSSDDTLKIIKDYNDSRIKVFQGPKKGVKQNFSNAISKCSGKYIFLSDQDDIWIIDKVNLLLEEFEKNNNTCCIVHDACIFDSKTNKIIENSYFKFRNSKKGLIHNIIKNSYIGCCMVFKNELKSYVLPIPNNIKMHDQWIGLIAEKYGEVKFISNALIKYRRHSENVTDMKCGKLSEMIKNRICLIKELIKRRLK